MVHYIIQYLGFVEQKGTSISEIRMQTNSKIKGSCFSRFFWLCIDFIIVEVLFFCKL